MKKIKKNEKKIILYGIHTINNILHTNKNKIINIYINKNKKNKRLKILINKIKKKKIKIIIKNKKFLNKITNKSSHQGIVALINNETEKKNNNILDIINKKKKILILIIDEITDTHNFGACIRNAESAGVNCIITTKKNAPKINGTIYKTSCGAIELIPLIKVENLIKTIKILKKNKIEIIGTCQKSNNIIYKNNLNKNIAIIIGSENKGIKKTIKNICNKIIKIPMYGKIKSLNASVSTGIILFEIIRQKKFNNFKNKYNI